MTQHIRGSRLLLINNLPSFYRTGPFAALADTWMEKTGGPTLCLFQARRDYHRRQEWFFTPDGEIEVPHEFLSSRTVRLGTRITYVPKTGFRRMRRFKPTHMLVAGWDTPAAVAAAGLKRICGDICFMSWVESNPTTTQLSGRIANRYRREFLRSSDSVLVPTAASASYVRALRGRDVPVLELPNPVTLQRIPGDGAVASSSKRMVFLGDLSRRKGFDIFAKGCELLEPEGWTGSAWGTDTEGLASMAPANCQVHPGRPLTELIPELRPTDVWIISSRSDPAPLTFSESMSLGLRAVVSHQIAYADRARETDGVSLFAGEDAESLRQAVLLISGQSRPSAASAAPFTGSGWAQNLTDHLLSHRSG